MPKMTKITWHIYKNIYLSNKIMLSGIFSVLFTEKIKNKLLGYHFLEKSYCEDNHRTIFEKSKNFQKRPEKNRKTRKKKKKKAVFPIYRLLATR